MDNSLDRGEPDASTFECFLRMQTLENTKQFILVLHVEPNSVVFHKQNHFIGMV